MVNNVAQNSAILLEHCSTILKGFENNDIQTGRKYNIFKITYINEKEVIMCRILADLLDPKGRHCRGDTYLNYFLEIINEKLRMPLSLNTKNARVYTEYSTDIKRRIDIVIDDGKTFIPIEVKIYARDQENQVKDYAQFSRLKNANNIIPVLYLTINGTNPDNAKENEYMSISFKTDILLWLNKCLRNNDTEKTVPIREILRQLIEAIKSICGKSEDEKMENAIKQLVIQSEDYVKAATAIKQAVETLEERTCELFKDKILPQLQKAIPSVIWKANYIDIPIKNESYYFAVTYKYEMTIWNINSSNSKEINNLRKKMSELTCASDEDWGDEYIWASSSIPYLGSPDIDENLFFYRLSKEYLENTSNVVQKIVQIANELNNA